VNMNALLLIVAAGAPAAPPADEVFPASYLRSESVRREIKLDPEVARKALAIDDDATARGKQAELLFAEGKPVDVEAARALPYQALDEIKRLLSRAQRKRLEEIYVQRAGVRVVLNTEVAAKLNLSDEQAEAIHAVYDEESRAGGEAERRAPRSKPGPEGLPKGFTDEESKAVEAERAKIRSRADREALKLLTKKQRAKLEAMRGEPFDPKKGSTPNQDEAKGPPK
jgi:hypothetical protein